VAQIENGFWVDKRGDRVHPDLVRADKKLEDELVERLVTAALVEQETLAELREWAFGEIGDFIDLLLQNYHLNRTETSKTGSVALQDFSGLNKVEIQIARRVAFDGKLKIAKLKIDEYLNEITQHAAPELKTLILKAFEVDRKGDVDAKKILALKSYDIPHQKWREAIEIINEATEIIGSRRYIRFYTRQSRDDEWEQIILELSGARKSAEPDAQEELALEGTPADTQEELAPISDETPQCVSA
jgi:hypothetical protein